MQQLQLSGEAFLRKILDGERNFDYVALPKGCDLHQDMGLFGEVRIKQYDPKKERFSMRGGEWVGVDASGFAFENWIGEGTNFSYANLSSTTFTAAIFDRTDFSNTRMYGVIFDGCRIQRALFIGANLTLAHDSFLGNKSNFRYTDFESALLSRASFKGTDFNCAKFFGANLQDAELDHSSLYEVDFRGANVTNTDFHSARLIKTDLRGVRNLEKARNLSYAVYEDTKVTPLEKATIETALQRAKRFDMS
ncbi:MAG: pentapeptide repeat-containing protein [Nanoarchaeota archaeon]|nr:pentapeptide repeat-containing protein [Nanoarchaeota archaeon]